MPRLHRWRTVVADMAAQAPPSSSITPKDIFLNRRQLVQKLSLGLAVLGATKVLGASNSMDHANAIVEGGSLSGSDCMGEVGDISLRESPTARANAESYNNYVEFSPNKEAVKFLAQSLTTSPWTLQIDGEVARTKTYDIDRFATLFDTEERLYRFRCVEGWSMVVPWNGFSLCRLLSQVQPTSRARYVVFQSVTRPSEMVNQRRLNDVFSPYQEALTIEEATHPLTMLATGFYGDSLSKQNGGPLRLVVPWKYGFKSIKALTRITLTEHKPITSWNARAPSEYGFYGNVNPRVAHPRWSQERESKLGELRKKPTLYLNGYAEQVAHLYTGIDERALY